MVYTCRIYSADVHDIFETLQSGELSWLGTILEVSDTGDYDVNERDSLVWEERAMIYSI